MESQLELENLDSPQAERIKKMKFLNLIEIWGYPLNLKIWESLEKVSDIYGF